ncbi:MAG: sugar-binding transcriptional regulator [Eubacteriaceae bacterium]|nr:sugar-binding transcriptional regulator [Eubacteriaceae bacterium]
MEDPRNTLIKIAHYYYRLDYTQSEIAEKLKMSRQRINRLLKKIRQDGIVKIHIEGFSESFVELESELETKYNLNRVIVISVMENENLYESLAMEGVNYLKSVLRDDLKIGISWGKTLYHLANNLPGDLGSFKNITVTQLVGGMSSEEGPRKSDEITRLIAEKLNAKPNFFYAPTFVSNPLVREAFMEEDSIKEVFAAIEKCDVVLLSIGEVSEYSSSLKTLLIDKEEYNEIKAKGGVGNISLRYFDENGKILDCNINRTVMGINPETFKKVPEVVCISGGKEKEKAILGALREGYIDTLITDEQTARNILAMDKPL